MLKFEVTFSKNNQRRSYDDYSTNVATQVINQHAITLPSQTDYRKLWTGSGTTLPVPALDLCICVPPDWKIAEPAL